MTLFVDGTRSRDGRSSRWIVIEPRLDSSAVSVFEHRSNLLHPSFVEIGTSDVAEQFRETRTR